MNIKDFDEKLPPGDMLENIFVRQQGLIEKYHVIEQKNLGYEIPHPLGLDLDERRSQQRLKDFAWRITEELAEATSCLQSAEKTDTIHYLEEMVDALHFTVEFLVMSGLTFEDFPSLDGTDRLDALFKRSIYISKDLMNPSDQRVIRRMTWEVVEKLGEAMNCLKNKPWKLSHMITDKTRYRFLVCEFVHLFIGLLIASGFEPSSLLQCYLNKNAVNKFRIRTNY